MQSSGRFLRAVALSAVLVFLSCAVLSANLKAADSSAGILGDEVYNYAETISGFGPRRPGTEPYERARDYISELTVDWGYRVWTDTIRSNQYFPESWSLKIKSDEDRDIETFPMRFSASTGPNGITAELIDVGKGTEKDFKGKDVAGKVVLVKWGHRILNLISLGALRESYQTAVDRGAAGYILYFTNTPGNSYQLMTAYAEEGSDRIPGFSIGKEDAAYLKKLLKKGEVKIFLHLVGEEREVDAHNVFAVLPGKSKDVILVDTHYCSMFAGAVDNASGVAVALALARHLSTLPVEEREKTLAFTFYGTHEYVDYKQGATKFLKDNPEIADNVAAAIGLDHMAAFPDKEYFGRDFRIHPMTPFPGMDQPRGLFVTREPAMMRAVFWPLVNNRLFPAVVLPNGLLDAIKFGESEGDSLLDWCICESSPPFRNGAPTLRLMMAPQWYHTRMDRAEHFTPGQLKRVADFHLQVIERIDETPAQKLAGKPFKR